MDSQTVQVASRKVKLASTDKQIFEVDRAVMKPSSFISNLILDLGLDNEEEGDTDPIPIKVAADHLKKVLSWLQHCHEDNAGVSSSQCVNEESEWEKNFVNELTTMELFELVQAANEMEISGLISCLNKAVADKIRGQDTAGMRKALFDI